MWSAVASLGKSWRHSGLALQPATLCAPPAGAEGIVIEGLGETHQNLAAMRVEARDLGDGVCSCCQEREPNTVGGKSVAASKTAVGSSRRGMLEAGTTVPRARYELDLRHERWPGAAG